MYKNYMVECDVYESSVDDWREQTLWFDTYDELEDFYNGVIKLNGKIRIRRMCKVEDIHIK